MVTIFENKTTEFKGLGLGALLPTSCRVKEELNGGFELTMEHPYDKYGKWERIEEEKILYASTPRGMQPFRIYRANKTMTGISVNARHIFYDMQDNLSELVDHTGNAADALSHLVSTFAYAMPFSFSTNITRNGTMFGEYINPVQALLSEDDTIDSFVKVYGGELLRNGFSVSMLDTIGEDRGVSIRYRKNLIGLEVDENTSELKTRIIVKNEAGTVVVKDSPYIDAYVYPKIHIVDAGKAAINEMERMAVSLLEEGIDLPNINIKVDFQTLSKTEEYKDYVILEEVQLGDTVRVINEKMRFSATRKVISYEWDAILEQYTFVELGDFLPSLSTTTNRVMQLVKSNLGKMTEIEVDIDGIRTRVSDAEGNISTLEQDADSIITTVENMEDEMSEIAQEADKISWIVSDGDDASNMTLTKDFLEYVGDHVTVKADLRLYGQMAVYKSETSNTVGGYIAYETDGDILYDGARGLVISDYDERNRLVVSDETVRMSFEKVDDNGDIRKHGIYCTNSGPCMLWHEVETETTEQPRTTSEIKISSGSISFSYGEKKALDENGDLDRIVKPIIFRMDFSRFVCTTDGLAMLGTESDRWLQVCAIDGEINTSDRKEKTDILYDMSKYEELFKRLKPTQFKRTTGTSGRFHTGFVAQDVEDAMNEIGMDSTEFAGFIKSPIYKTEVNDNGEEVETDEVSGERYALRYGEFIALNTHMIQKLMAKVEELENRIAKLEG